MRVKYILSLAIAASMSISGMSFAADGDKPKPEGDKPAPKKPEGKPGERPAGGDIKRLDTDKDGKISKAEAEAAPRLKENFAKLDGNSDGFIDEAEFKAAAAKREGKPGEKKPEGGERPKKPDAPK